MNSEILALSITAATLGFLHTLSGPDHYVPFIVMSKARNWSYAKTIWITILCGLGHVGSSIAIGAIGIIFGLGVAKLEIFEGYRGSLAAWLFILFGLGYFIWGLWRGIKNKGHRHIHTHNNTSVHSHNHDHPHDHEHTNGKTSKVNLTPWILFTIFVFGPCEPLIPLLMFPAAEESTAGIVIVAAVFSIVTILTMLFMVLLPLMGLKMLPMKFLERYMHAIAGFTILICGIGIEFLGL
jgi:ABC-type nickel/cobalt efflux system permease component RcnA